jgi:hypothetical protein
VNEVNRLHRNALESVRTAESATKGFRIRRSHPPPLPHTTPVRKQFRAGDARRSAGEAGSTRASQHRMLEHTAFEFRECRRHRSWRGFYDGSRDSLLGADFAESFAASGNQRTNTGNEATDSFRGSTEK